MTDRFRVHVSKAVEHVFVIEAESAHAAESLAETWVQFGEQFGGEIPHRPAAILALTTIEGSHLEVTSQRIPKEGA